MASVSLTLLPLTSFAYSLNHFQLQAAIVTSEDDEELLEQQWDTQCREQMGIEGGNLLGALRFNLNRCINTHRRQSDLQERNKSFSSRKQARIDKVNIQSGEDLKERISTYQQRTYQQRLRTRIEFRNTLPQSQNQQQKSFQYVRSRNRISVQAKEQSIQTTKKLRSMYISKARMSCVDLHLNDKAACILEKLNELMEGNE